MPGRGRHTDPPLEIRQLTTEAIRLGITKLKKRISEVQDLETKGVKYGDQRIRTVEQNIAITILEIFGENSPEYREHQHHRIWHGTMSFNMSQAYLQACFKEGIPQTITMLQGIINRLEEKITDREQGSTLQPGAGLEVLNLHPRIAQASLNLFRDGHYRNAVLDAMVALQELVKERSGRNELDGVSLMTTVFSKKNPILAVNDLTDQTDRDEQEGVMHLFVGAVLALRNPRAHALQSDDRTHALECLALIDLLAKTVERARRLNP